MAAVRSLVHRLSSRSRPDGISAVAQQVRDEHLTYLDPAKLELLESCIHDVRRIRGDFLEMGVAMGGSAIVLAEEWVVVATSMATTCSR